MIPQKRVIAPNWSCWDTKNPIARNNRGVSLRVSRNTGPLSSPRAERLKKFKISLRDWKVQASSLKMSSEPTTKPLFYLWEILKVEIEKFKRDWSFQVRFKIFSEIVPKPNRMRLFCLQLEASCLQWSFFCSQLTILAFVLTIGAFLLTTLAVFLTIGAFLLTVKKCV